MDGRMCGSGERVSGHNGNMRTVQGCGKVA